MMLRLIPNIITTFRILLLAPFILMFTSENYRAAFYVFFLAGFSDFMDGLLARHFHWTTRYGAMMDPIADKLLVVTASALLTWQGSLPLWLFVLVIMRDLIIISGMCTAMYICGRKGVDVKVSFVSKFNTVLQIGLLIFLLFQLAFYTLPVSLITLTIYTMALTSLWSAVGYIVDGTRLVMAHKQQEQ